MTGRLATQRLLYHGESDVAAGGMCVGGCQLSHLLHLSRILSLPLHTLLPQQPAFTAQHSTNYSTFTSQHPLQQRSRRHRPRCWHQRSYLHRHQRNWTELGPA